MWTGHDYVPRNEDTTQKQQENSFNLSDCLSKSKAAWTAYHTIHSQSHSVFSFLFMLKGNYLIDLITEVYL